MNPPGGGGRHTDGLRSFLMDGKLVGRTVSDRHVLGQNYNGRTCFGTERFGGDGSTTSLGYFGIFM